MNLREVAAVSAERLPDVGHSVKPDDVYSLIAEIEHVFRHVVEDYGISVVQVPLIGIERSHYYLAGLLVEREISGGSCRENFR